MSKSKVVLVTGNQGFIGSWLALHFLRQGWKVIGLDNRTSPGLRMADEIGLENKVSKQYLADICDLDTLKKIFDDEKPELVVNMAGQAIVPRAHREPYETFRTNTLGTVSILEAARLTKVPKSVICITSDKVYKNNEQVWPYRENDTLGGKDIYSVSKSSAELVVGAYAQTHLSDLDLNIQSVRLGNVVGGGDWSKNRLIPDLMYLIPEGGGKFLIRYPNATRPFQHVLDVTDGVIKISEASLARKVKTGEGWNLGPKNNTVGLVTDVVEKCRSLWPVIKVEQDPNRVKEDINLSVEIAKFKSTFGAPKYTSDEAIDLTLRWYKNYFDKKSVSDLIENDFKTFESAK
jgi:CDP-glucose 4,6-dehydratase